MKAPTMLYMFGESFKFEGKSYDTIIVDASDVEDMLKDGWSKHPSECGVDVVSPPTREELEAKATELEIKFNARTKDETLASKIEEALKA